MAFRRKADLISELTRVVPPFLCIALLFFLNYPSFNFICKAAVPYGLPVHNLTTGLDYQTIQLAIDANETSDGDVIFVDAGVYKGNITVFKSLTIIGENRSTTIVNGSSVSRCFTVIAERVNITGFTIQNARWAVYLDLHNESNIYGNRIRTSDIGIYFNGVKKSTAYGNIIEDINLDGEGIYLREAENNLIQGNLITNALYGVSFMLSKQNIVKVNTIANCTYAFYVDSSSNNSIHHNNILFNSYSFYTINSVNDWDDGYPSGGNYWSDYAGVDEKNGLNQGQLGSDGIGDTPYALDADDNDTYPLMAPFYTFEAGSWNGTAYNVDVVSNSTISYFQLNETTKTISFNVTGLNYTLGFSRVTIPDFIVQELWQGNYNVLVDGEAPLETKNWTDARNTYVYFTYQHSEHEITILPELASTPILLLAALFSTFAVMLAKKTF